MVVCKFWLQNGCRYGNDCRFEHAEPASNRGARYDRYDGGRDRGYGYENRNYQQTQHRQQPSNTATGNSLQEILSNLKQEIESCEQGNQWPFSCFSPFKDGCNYPGFEDTSPEEMRFSAYNFQLQNDMQSYLQLFQRMRNEMNMLRQNLKHPKGDVLKTLEQIHQGSLVQTTPSQQQQHQFGTGQRITTVSRSPDASSFKFDLSRLDSAPSHIPAGNFGFFSGNSNMGNATQTFGTSTNVGFGSSAPSGAMFGSSASSGALFANFQTHAAPITVPDGLFSSGPALTNNFSNNNTGFGQSNVFAAPQIVTPQVVAPQQNVFTTPATTNPKVSQHVQESCWHSQMLFSPLESLSADDKSEFGAPHFRIGFVPTVPPPQEMCL